MILLLYGFDSSTILPMTPDDLNRFVLNKKGLFYIKDNGDKVRLTHKSNTKKPLAESTIEKDLGTGWFEKIFPGVLHSDYLKIKIEKENVRKIC